MTNSRLQALYNLEMRILGCKVEHLTLQGKRSYIASWKMKDMRASKDLKKLPMEELLDTLKIHEEAFDEEGSDEDELSFNSRKIHSMHKNKGGSK
ncbi:hypothetical protein CR513_43583, partial [Mucuna pruriens]